MLDLSGFESLTRNGLEQLCINAANERLQALCDACIVDREQQIYELEGVAVARMGAPDRSAVLALLEDPRTGLFSMLDEVRPAARTDRRNASCPAARPRPTPARSSSPTVPSRCFSARARASMADVLQRTR